MLPADAWGELLAVGAVPVAVLIGMIAAILARRWFRLAIAVLALAVLTLVGMLAAGRALMRPMWEARDRQAERFAPLEIGLTRAEVRSALGPPDLECPGDGAYRHEARATEELVSRLFDATAERWIYFLPDAPRPDHPECRPLYAEGEVGFNDAGRVLWYIELTDETFLTF